jgi:hypothetical protein
MMESQTGLPTTKKFYGKFKGTVVTNIDPLQQGRLVVQVPDVLGADPCIWASSASPLAGPQMGMYYVPPIGAGVWVEFEQGDPNFAIWTGCWRGAPSDVPAEALASPPPLPPIVMQTQAQNKIVISSVPGDGIRLETAAGPLGPSIAITPVGIVLSDGKGAMITLSAGVVTVNQGALVVK